VESGNKITLSSTVKGYTLSFENFDFQNPQPSLGAAENLIEPYIEDNARSQVLNLCIFAC
jgi:hypothetical protein